MSRTPETIRDKRAEKKRNNFYLASIAAAVLSWMAFNHHHIGVGFLLLGAALVLGLIGDKIKTTLRKQREIGVYR